MHVTALLLVWQCTDRPDCTYGQVGIVKRDAGALGVSWVTNGAPNMLRSLEMIAGMRDRP